MAMLLLLLLQTYVLRAAEGDTVDAGNVLQTQLSDGLAGLLLVTGVDSDGGTSGDVGLAGLGLGVTALLDSLGDLLIGELFNAGIGHCVIGIRSIQR